MAQAWKMPPLIKVYEATGAVGDGRVRIVDEANALVTSSDGSKTYSMYIGDGGRAIASDDNASRWQGYVGYLEGEPKRRNSPLTWGAVSRLRHASQR
jgi:hypothetical protein